MEETSIRTGDRRLLGPAEVSEDHWSSDILVSFPITWEAETWKWRQRMRSWSCPVAPQTCWCSRGLSRQALKAAQVFPHQENVSTAQGTKRDFNHLKVSSWKTFDLFLNFWSRGNRIWRTGLSVGFFMIWTKTNGKVSNSLKAFKVLLYHLLLWASDSPSWADSPELGLLC